MSSLMFSYFWCQTSSVRSWAPYPVRTFPDQDPGWFSGSKTSMKNVWHKKYENKTEGIENYLKYSFHRLLKISHCLRYRAPDPVFGQNRILIPGPKGGKSAWKLFTQIIYSKKTFKKTEHNEMQTDLTRVKWRPAFFELQRGEKPEQCRIYDHFQCWKLNLMELLKLWRTTTC